MIDESQSFNLFIKGVSGTKLSETYLYAWEKGLKTTYYLRSLAASQIEKSTLNAEKYGFTQKREYKNFDVSEKIQEVERLKEITTKQKATASNFDLEISNGMSATEFTNGKVCSLLDPDCEACQ